MNDPTILEFIFEYYRVFSTLELDAILNFYSEPCIWVGPQGIYGATNRTELAKGFGTLIEGLKTRGYGHSEFEQPEVTILSETAALVRGVAVRYLAQGAVLERVPLSYVLHRSDAGWTVAVMVLGEPENG